jgi:hypothetical protein
MAMTAVLPGGCEHAKHYAARATKKAMTKTTTAPSRRTGHHCLNGKLRISPWRCS